MGTIIGDALRQGTADVKADVKQVAKDIKDIDWSKLEHWIAKYFPLDPVARRAYRTLLALNYRGHASRASRANTEQRKALEHIWYLFGGDPDKYWQSVDAGKHKKPILCGVKCEAQFTEASKSTPVEKTPAKKLQADGDYMDIAKRGVQHYYLPPLMADGGTDNDTETSAWGIPIRTWAKRPAFTSFKRDYDDIFLNIDAATGTNLAVALTTGAGAVAIAAGSPVTGGVIAAAGGMIASFGKALGNIPGKISEGNPTADPTLPAGVPSPEGLPDMDTTTANVTDAQAAAAQKNFIIGAVAVGALTLTTIIVIYKIMHKQK